MKIDKLRLFLLCLGIASIGIAHAEITSTAPTVYSFDNQVDAKRFEHLTEVLRCPKCQNQNLAGSDAPIAVDMKTAIYQAINDNQSDQQITQNLVDSYGDFILYNPPFKPSTWLLWGLPPTVLILVAIVLLWRRRANATPLVADDSDPMTRTAQQQAQIQWLLQESSKPPTDQP